VRSRDEAGHIVHMRRRDLLHGSGDFARSETVASEIGCQRTVHITPWVATSVDRPITNMNSRRTLIGARVDQADALHGQIAQHNFHRLEFAWRTMLTLPLRLARGAPAFLICIRHWRVGAHRLHDALKQFCRHVHRSNLHTARKSPINTSFSRGTPA